MAVATRAVAINAAFFREIKEDNEELRFRLRLARAAFEHPHSDAASKAWVEALELLRDQLALHFALEEAYGYFEGSIANAPRLGRRAEELRSEHADLYLELVALCERAEDVRRRDSSWQAVQQLAGAFARFDERLAAHESHENDLILAALDDDIGTGD